METIGKVSSVLGVPEVGVRDFPRSMLWARMGLGFSGC